MLHANNGTRTHARACACGCVVVCWCTCLRQRGWELTSSLAGLHAARELSCRMPHLPFRVQDVCIAVSHATTLHHVAPCCMLHGISCKLQVACCMQRQRRPAYCTPCLLCRCMLHVGCRMSHVACCKLVLLVCSCRSRSPLPSTHTRAPLCSTPCARKKARIAPGGQPAQLRAPCHAIRIIPRAASRAHVRRHPQRLSAYPRCPPGHHKRRMRAREECARGCKSETCDGRTGSCSGTANRQPQSGRRRGTHAGMTRG
jgi:hypothetical protein